MIVKQGFTAAYLLNRKVTGETSFLQWKKLADLHSDFMLLYMIMIHYDFKSEWIALSLKSSTLQSMIMPIIQTEEKQDILVDNIYCSRVHILRRQKKILGQTMILSQHVAGAKKKV